MRNALLILLTLLGLAVSLLTVALLTLNKDSVEVQLGVFDLPSMPLGQLLAFTVSTGLILGLLAVSPFALRSANRRRRLTRRLADLNSEVHELRTLPLRGDS